jgi:hypothetical protein
MANEQNLRSLGDVPEEERKAIQSAGGIASGKVRRKAKNMREAARFLLEAPLLDDPATAAALQTLGLEADQQSAILLKAIEQARRGDMESARYARDTSGQAPAQAVELGGMEGQPIETLDLSKMSTAELQKLLAEQPKTD